VKNENNTKNDETTKTRRLGFGSRSPDQDTKKYSLRGSSCLRGYRVFRRRFFVAVTALCLLWISAGGPRVAAQQPPRRAGRIFSPTDIGLLEAPDREAWQKPDQVMDSLQIAEGSVAADLGAGGGWFTIRLARRVGPNGLVYAEDIQRLMIEAIQRRVQREGLTNVRTQLGTKDDPGLPAGAIDAGITTEIWAPYRGTTW